MQDVPLHHRFTSIGVNSWGACIYSTAPPPPIYRKIRYKMTIKSRPKVRYESLVLMRRNPNLDAAIICKSTFSGTNLGGKQGDQHGPTEIG